MKKNEWLLPWEKRHKPYDPCPYIYVRVTYDNNFLAQVVWRGSWWQTEGGVEIIWETRKSDKKNLRFKTAEDAMKFIDDRLSQLGYCDVPAHLKSML